MKAGNSLGDSAYSGSSNSVTPVTPTAFESIATATGTGSSNTITFSSIPGTYQHLQVRCIAFASSGQLLLRLNGDTGTNYTRHTLNGYNSTVSAAGNTAQSSIRVCIDDGARASMETTFGTVAIIDIHDYASTTRNKTVRAFGGKDDNTAADSEIDLNSGLWINTSAVTSITILNSGAGNFTTSSTFALYGIKGA